MNASTKLARPAFRHVARVNLPRFPRRTFLSPKPPSGRAVERLNARQLARESDEYARNRQAFLAAGLVTGIISIAWLSWKLKLALERDARRKLQMDSALPADQFTTGTGGNRKVVLHDDEDREIVPTGNSTIPTFPRTLDLPSHWTAAAADTTRGPAQSDPFGPGLVTPANMTGHGAAAAATTTTEYTLVGTGTRTVSFLGIQVYVLGYYVATADVAALQAALVKKVNPIASTLVAGEKDTLRASLMDPVDGEAAWEELLAAGVPARSAFRIVPVRDTDFPHLRDGLVRAVQARSQHGTLKQKETYGGEGFGEAIGEFRRLFNRGKVPKRKELLMVRDGEGRLSVVFDDGSGAGRQLLGTVADERLSRALWMNYLGGKKVASEPAKKSIVDGVMEFVERPIGTVAAQVV